MSTGIRPEGLRPARTDGDARPAPDTKPDTKPDTPHVDLRAALEALPAGFCLYDAEDRLVFCNERDRQFYPEHANALQLGRRFEDMLREGVGCGVFAGAVGREEEWIAERLRHHVDPQGPIEQRLTDGRWLRIEERRTAEGKLIGLRTDITDLKLMEQALKENEERFRDFTEASADWVWEMDADLRFTFMSGNVERIVGIPAEWHHGKTREELLGDDYDHETWDRHLETLRNRQPFRNFEYQRVGEGIEPRWLRVSGLPRFDEDGTFLGYRGTGTDVTEQKMAEAKLRASETKLARAQKTESIGRLTAGVAHDFNNLLAVIQGNLELIEERLADPELQEMIDAALKSVSRGAELTGQLLLFSRRALLAPEVIDLNHCVMAMGEMIRRTVPASIAVDIGLAEDLWPAMLDQSQLEAAILNIVVNAKDVMPEGGRLTIWTENVELSEKDLGPFTDGVEPGRYVMIGAADTGSAMDEETLAHVFEPFFTTKEVGRGTGLGLSMVQGFVQHSRGDVLIESKLGQGTTVRLYFPAGEPTLNDGSKETDAPLARARPGDCVLVVEDEADVRRVVAALLQDLGYDVIQAMDGIGALKVLRSKNKIDALLTDVVMPGSPQGPALAEEARKLRPGIGVVLMTGYPSKAAAAQVRTSRSWVCLSKPVRKRALACEIWKQIHGGTP